MRIVRRTSHFKKDVKRLIKRNKNFDNFKNLVQKLVNGEKPDFRNRDHPLVGEYKRFRECHVEPDWLLIYEITDDEVILVRTGTHSDLFG
jgi:mRNA interferase YafQ